MTAFETKSGRFMGGPKELHHIVTAALILVEQLLVLLAMVRRSREARARFLYSDYAGKLVLFCRQVSLD